MSNGTTDDDSSTGVQGSLVNGGAIVEMVTAIINVCEHKSVYAELRYRTTSPVRVHTLNDQPEWQI